MKQQKGSCMTRRQSGNAGILPVAILALSGGCASPTPEKGFPQVSPGAIATAQYALDRYRDDIIETMASLVAFRTVHQPGLPNAENPEFLKMTEYLRTKASELGLDFEDRGAVVLIGLGDPEERVGIVTHGDVQPADASQWVKSPFELDRETDPHLLIGRGTEDDKGPIAMALFGMKALADRGLTLTRRIELIISYTEESDWTPMIEFLQRYRPPAINIALDSRFPVVSAEKGFCLVHLSLPATSPPTGSGAVLSEFRGGAFVSQIPGEAVAVINGSDQQLEERLRQAVAESPLEEVDVTSGSGITLTARGLAAHSSEPEAGVNALVHSAEILSAAGLDRGSSAGWMVNFISRYLSGGHHGEKFGSIAYSHDFMGPMTVAPTWLRDNQGRLVLTINLRRPAGKSSQQLENEIRETIQGWQAEHQIEDLQTQISIGDPHLAADAPQVPVLLGIYSHYTGDPHPQAESAGGGTHARLLPHGVSFGPHMPGRSYTGHTEREYLSLEEFDRDIRMYTAMLVELAAR